MALPSFSYRPPRGAPTRRPEPRDDTDSSFDPDDSLFPTDDPDAPPTGAASQPLPPPPAGEPQARRARADAESARHVVLRRLAPALKHDMVVNLQAVSMMAEMLNARMERGSLEQLDLQASIGKLNRLARDAVLKCVRVSSWIEPGEDDAAPLHEVVQECVSLMAGSLNFRGFRLSADVPQSELLVTRSTLRTLAAASIITLSDSASGPAELTIVAEVSPGHAVLTVSCMPDPDGAAPLQMDPPGPRVDWGDVQALAKAESVDLFRTASQVVMRLPRALPSSPLRMAPM